MNYTNLIAGIRCRESHFWSFVDKNEGCWEWTGTMGSKGYGRFTVGNWITEGAHRVAYTLAFGVYPGPLFVCHHCDNPPCCRPDHLFLGTALDNSRDAQAKGRLVQKVTLAMREEIRAAMQSGISKRELAEQYNLSWKYVNVLVKGIPANYIKRHPRHDAVWITYQQETKTLIDWARYLGVHHKRLRRRKDRGWTDEEILFGKK